MPGLLRPALSAARFRADRTLRIVTTGLDFSGRNLQIALICIAALALACTGCGPAASEGGNYGGAHPDYAKALAGSPAPLATLHAKHDRLLPGGLAAFQKAIAALHGYPAVVNVWASWCWPCREEFPVLQKLSAKYGREVAFLGVDSDDSNAAASSYLKERPVPYPSFADPGKQIAAALHVGFGIPDTAFYGPGGKLLYLKQGPYAHPVELEADLERYALR